MSDTPGDIIAVRDDEQLPAARLQAWLQQQGLPGTDGTMQIRQFSGGKANLTYLLEFAEHSYVLRRPPLGPVAKGAHDMGREYKVLSRLYRAFPQAPRAFLYSDEPAIVGSEFFIMEYRTGVVVRETLPECYAGMANAPRQLSLALVDALADFHNVAPAAVDLADLGKPEGFIERQVHGWQQRWQACVTAPDERMAAVYDWLVGNQPKSQRVTLVHNDFKLDNAMFAGSDPGQLTSVFDWDMCTLGDPLSDLGTLLTYWAHPSDDPTYRPLAMMPVDERFPQRAELVARYAERTGLATSAIQFYHVLGLYRLTVILEQIYARYVSGQTRDQRFADFGEKARLALRWAHALAITP